MPVSSPLLAAMFSHSKIPFKRVGGYTWAKWDGAQKGAARRMEQEDFPNIGSRAVFLWPHPPLLPAASLYSPTLFISRDFEWGGDGSLSFCQLQTICQIFMFYLNAFYILFKMIFCIDFGFKSGTPCLRKIFK